MCLLHSVFHSKLISDFEKVRKQSSKEFSLQDLAETDEVAQKKEQFKVSTFCHYSVTTFSFYSG